MASSSRRHDVFISFRGEETRDNFTSHLIVALCRKKIETFMDNEITRRDEISTFRIEVHKWTIFSPCGYDIKLSSHLKYMYNSPSYVKFWNFFHFSLSICNMGVWILGLALINIKLVIEDSTSCQSNNDKLSEG